MKQVNGAWLVLSAAVLWGTTGTTQALAPEDASSASIGTVRLVIGGISLLVFALWRGALRGGALLHSGRWPVGTTLVAAASMAAYQILFFAGVGRAGVAVGTIVGIGSSPILAGAIGYLVLKEKPGVRWGVATLLAFTGCAILVGAGEGIRADPIGILLAVGAGGAYAMFTVFSKILLKNKPSEAVMAVTFCLGAVFLIPVLFGADLSWIVQPRGMAVALHLGLVTVGIAYTLFGWGLQRVPVATAATLTLAEPLTAGFLGVVLLGERLTAAAAAGILFIFAGLALLTLSPKTASSEPG
jgi:DME family drug/metabolite transporter